MVSVQERNARESEALRNAQRQALGPNQDDEIAFANLPGAEGKYTEVLVDPQWLSAWKMYVDREGQEYGVAVLLPRGQWDQGGPNALMNLRRSDGGYAFTLIQPERLEPEPKIECFVGVCPKRLNTRIELVEHVKTFHTDEAVNYQVVLDQIMQQAIKDDPRLQKVIASLETLEQTAMGESPANLAALEVEVFHCEHETCKRFFDSEQGRRMHMREHKEA